MIRNVRRLQVANNFTAFLVRVLVFGCISMIMATAIAKHTKAGQYIHT